MERVVLRTKNYVYVFHSGDLDNLMFMGMTCKAYESAKSVYNVSCFIRSYKDLDSSLEEIEEYFKLDSSLRSIPKNISKQQAIDCAKEFYSEGLDKIFSNFDRSQFIIDKLSWRGVLYKGEEKLDLELLLLLDKGDFIHKFYLDNIIDFSVLANEYVNFGKRSSIFSDYVKRLYMGDSRYMLLEIAENDDTTLISDIINLPKLTVPIFDSSIEPKYFFSFGVKHLILF